MVNKDCSMEVMTVPGPPIVLTFHSKEELDAWRKGTELTNEEKQRFAEDTKFLQDHPLKIRKGWFD